MGFPIYSEKVKINKDDTGEVIKLSRNLLSDSTTRDTNHKRNNQHRLNNLLQILKGDRKDARRESERRTQIYRYTDYHVRM